MNILLMSSKYPGLISEKGFTPVVHYFAKEWVKMGHNVKVIHNQSKFPKILYLTPKFIINFFESKLGFTFPKSYSGNDLRYVLDSVNVHKILIFRIFPFINYFRSTIDKQIKKIINSNVEDNFVPDIIISHFANPQIPIGAYLKDMYKCSFVVVLHSIDRDLFRYRSIMDKVDAFGFRSISIRKRFFDSDFEAKGSFLCYSGIDELEILPHHKLFSNNIEKFLFVGVLIKRKFADVVIKAINSLGYDSTLEIIGDGPELSRLKTLSLESSPNNRILFSGHNSREYVLSKMSVSECFIMISENEVFGLVYIEAMAKGCIVIASKNEGMEGIIKHSENGFLCEAGNLVELCQIIKTINSLSIIEKSEISKNAIKTANSFTEEKVAQTYLNSII